MPYLAAHVGFLGDPKFHTDVFGCDKKDYAIRHLIPNDHDSVQYQPKKPKKNKTQKCHNSAFMWVFLVI